MIWYGGSSLKTEGRASKIDLNRDIPPWAPGACFWHRPGPRWFKYATNLKVLGARARAGGPGTSWAWCGCVGVVDKPPMIGTTTKTALRFFLKNVEL